MTGRLPSLGTYFPPMELPLFAQAGDQETERRVGEQETSGPGDRRTRIPGDQRNTGPEDQETED